MAGRKSKSSGEYPGGKRSRRSSKELTSEDRALWNKVTQTVDPLKSSKRPLMDTVSELPQGAKDDLSTSPKAFTVGPAKQSRDLTENRASTSSFTVSFTPEKSKSSEEYRIDRRTRSDIVKGKMPIGGRIDLHGMNQNEAYSALYSFLVRAQQNNWKAVLVITGKGRTFSKKYNYDDILPQSGVLRQRVPYWLTEKRLKGIVLGFEEAHTTHGGQGALYVRIRRHGQR